MISVTEMQETSLLAVKSRVSRAENAKKKNCWDAVKL